MLAQYRGPKSRSSLEAVSTSGSAPDETDGASPVLLLPSSTELFYFYAQILEQCAKMFTGQPLFDLCQLFKKWLKIYAGKSCVYHPVVCMRLTIPRSGCPGGKHEKVMLVI